MIRKITLLVLTLFISQLSWCQDAFFNQSILLKEASLSSYSLPSVDHSISLEISNNSGDPINSLDIIWSDGVNEHLATVKTNIPQGESVSVKHPVPVNYSGIVEKDILVKVLKVNSNAINYSVEKQLSFNTVLYKTKKSVLFEMSSGTWNGYSPKGIVAFKNMQKKYPKSFIGVKVHVSDPMNYKEYHKKLNLRGVPMYNTDRQLKDKLIFLSGDKSVEACHQKRLKEVSPVSLGGFVLPKWGDNNKVRISTYATFLTNFSSADFRFGVIVTEDKVSGESRAYNQVNYYANGKNGEMGGFEKLPVNILAKDMVYNDVARALIGGYKGQENSVSPSKAKLGKTARYTFEYEIPEGYNRDNLNFIIVLIDQKNNTILNSKKLKQFIKLPAQFDVAEVKGMPKVVMYPNPVTNFLNISFNSVPENSDYIVTVSDVLGRVVLTKKYFNLKGQQNMQLSISELKSGNYLVSVAGDGTSFTKQVVVE